MAERLSELLGRRSSSPATWWATDAQAKAAALQPGEILLLENTRFEKGETKNDPDFAKAWPPWQRSMSPTPSAPSTAPTPPLPVWPTICPPCPAS